MQNLGGQTKSIMVFSELAYCLNCIHNWDDHSLLDLIGFFAEVVILPKESLFFRTVINPLVTGLTNRYPPGYRSECDVEFVLFFRLPPNLDSGLTS